MKKEIIHTEGLHDIDISKLYRNPEDKEALEVNIRNLKDSFMMGMGAEKIQKFTDSVIEIADVLLRYKKQEPFDFGKWLLDLGFSWNNESQEWCRSEEINPIYTRKIFMQDGCLCITEVDEIDWWIAYRGDKPTTQADAETLFRLLNIGKEKDETINN